MTRRKRFQRLWSGLVQRWQPSVYTQRGLIVLGQEHTEEHNTGDWQSSAEGRPLSASGHDEPIRGHRCRERSDKRHGIRN